MSHLNYLRWGQSGTGMLGPDPRWTGLWQLYFRLKVRDCHNPTVVLEPWGNSQGN